MCKGIDRKIFRAGGNEKKQNRKIAPLTPLSTLSISCMKIQGGLLPAAYAHGSVGQTHSSWIPTGTLRWFYSLFLKI